ANHPGGISRTELQLRLFPDVDRRRGGNHFRQVVFKLRELTGLSPVRPDASMVAWTPGAVTSDAVLFEQLVESAKGLPPAEARPLLKQALDLVTGTFLAGSDLQWVD